MRLLEAVNLILRKLGEIEVPTLDEPYPTIPMALAALSEARGTVLKEGWWFNTAYNWEATPDGSGLVYLPENTLMFYTEDPQYTFDGTRVVLTDSHSPVIGKAVRGRLVMDKDFESLPYTAAMAVTYTAAFQTYESDIGPDKTSQSLAETQASYLMTLSAEHTRSRKRNSTNKRAFQQWKRRLTT